jgi:O-antigen ligase
VSNLPINLTHFKTVNPGWLFAVGWAVMMVAVTYGIQPVWNSFIHQWKPELFGSLLLLGIFGYVLARRDELVSNTWITGKSEIYFIIIPIVGLIVWSIASAVWASSISSAVHHALVWAGYLSFYVVIRRLLESGRNYGKMADTLAAVFAFLGVLAVFSYIAFLAFGGGTNIGIAFSKHTEQVVAILPLIIVGVVRQQGRRFVLGLGALALLWLMIFTAQSRTSLYLFIGIVISMIAASILLPRFARYRKRLAIVGAVFILAPVPFLVVPMLGGANESPVAFGRLRDEKGLSSSNDFRKLMIAVSAEMIRANPIIGVGADNFGFEANRYRQALAAKDPTNPVHIEAEDTIPERAHNEYLQIAAELGIIGLGIFAIFLAGIALMGFRLLKNYRSVSPHAFAAMLGLVAFLASSFVTSFSFRFVQNGFVFFFVLAVAAKFLMKERRSGRKDNITLGVPQMRVAISIAAVAAFLLFGHSLIRMSSAALTQKAGQTANLEDARSLYDTALRLDGENPEAHYFLALRLLDAKRYHESAHHFRRSIDIGKARSADYAFLATAQTLAGDPSAAEATFAEAASMYPRSVFVLARYAAYLAANGKHHESAIQLERARSIDPAAAGTWWALINDGAKKASDFAFQSKGDNVPVMELTPNNSLYAVIAERDILFPDERQKFPWENAASMGSQ